MYTRRNSLKVIAMSAVTTALPKTLQAQNNAFKPLKKKLSFGIITDVHIGFIKGAEDRLDTFLTDMKQINPTGLIQMGDFANPNTKHQPIVDKFNKATQYPIHAIGNHELDHGLTREHAKESWGIPSYYYSKEVEGIKIIVLDGNDRGSPTYHSHGGYHSYIGEDQRQWLKQELEASTMPVLIVSHQGLAGSYPVDNASQIQKILTPYKHKILACLNGHSHVDQHVVIDGVNYLHINSASYYWLGGKVRTATYKEALYTVMTIDPDSGTVSFKECVSEWGSGTPEQAGYYDNGKNADKKAIVVPKISARKFPFK